MTIPTSADLLHEIEGFLTATGMTPTRFGKDVMSDPAFVLKLRRGRTVALETAIKVRRFMEGHSAEPARRSA